MQIAAVQMALDASVYRSMYIVYFCVAKLSSAIVSVRRSKE